MKNLLIVCLHGFLGKGEDWSLFRAQLKKKLLGIEPEFWCPSLLNGSCQLGPDSSLDEWSSKFINELSQFTYKKCLLVGYSMGGRLAFNTIAKYPDRFSGAIFLSTNPMVLSTEQLEQRRAQDSSWSKKFLTEEWQSLINQWNQQEVFLSEKSHPERCEKDYSRKSLAKALQNWSITHQRLSINDWTKIKVPSLWVAGGNDHKFVAILKHLQLKGLPAEFLVLPNSGHRIGISENSFLMESISSFIDKI